MWALKIEQGGSVAGWFVQSWDTSDASEKLWRVAVSPSPLFSGG